MLKTKDWHVDRKLRRQLTLWYILWIIWAREEDFFWLDCRDCRGRWHWPAEDSVQCHHNIAARRGWAVVSQLTSFSRDQYCYSLSQLQFCGHFGQWIITSISYIALYYIVLHWDCRYGWLFGSQDASYHPFLTTSTSTWRSDQCCSKL